MSFKIQPYVKILFSCKSKTLSSSTSKKDKMIQFIIQDTSTTCTARDMSYDVIRNLNENKILFWFASSMSQPAATFLSSLLNACQTILKMMSCMKKYYFPTDINS